jgi:hypothetical protein
MSAVVSRAALAAALLSSALTVDAEAQGAPAEPAPVASEVPPGPPPVEPVPAVEPVPPIEAVPPVADAPTTPEKAEENGVSWRYDKGFIAATADEKFELKLGLRTQTRLEVTRPEAKDEFESRFFLPRIRLQLEGFAYGKANTYKLEYDAGNQGFSAIKDFFVEHSFTSASAPAQVRLRLGQWKKPFNRQELTSDFALALAERHASGAFAGSGRDIGLALHSGYEKSPSGVEWALGVFNGTTEKSTQKLTCAAPEDPTEPIDPSDCKVGLPSNVPTDFLPELVARLGWNQGGEDGIKGYSELDLEGGPLRFAVAAAYRVRLNDLVDSDALEHGAEADFVVKVHGFDVGGAVLVSKKGTDDAELGGYGQAGFVAVPRRLAIVGRFGSTPIDGSEKNKLETIGGVNLLAQGHNMKLVLEGGVVHDTGTQDDDLVARAQAQLVF